MATDKNITGALGVLAAGYPNFNLTPETIRVYQRTLSDIPAEVLEQAVVQLLTTSRFFPTVAEIREACFAIMTNAAEIPSAFEAWAEAIDHCRRGYYEGYSHPLIEKAVKQIGIPYWQNMMVDDEMATRAHFFRIYECLYKRADADMKMLPAVKEFAGRYQIEAQERIKLLTAKMEAK
jgi:hypothetical protein